MNYYEVAPTIIARQNSDFFTYHATADYPVGTIIEIPIGNKRLVPGVVLGQTNKPSFKTKPITRQIIKEPLPPELIATAQWMAEYYATPLPSIISMVLPEGLEVARRATIPELPQINRAHDHPLTQNQFTALRKLTEANDQATILHGDTGSGKTRLYRERSLATLGEGRSVIVLVPEIALTSQLVADFSDLSEHVFFTHSQLTNSQRHIIWLQILQQKAPVVVIGPRSALFMPVRNVGLIVVDEAHESSYKQDVSPKYDAPVVARKLASLHAAQTILGTATPRITDYFIARERSSPVIELPPLHETAATTIVVDQKDKRSQFQRDYHLSDQLISAMETALQQQTQTLLYLNRRGTASLALCSKCGWHAECPTCFIPLTLHSDQHRLRCHLCNYHRPALSSCPDCGSTEVRFNGAGTKQVVESVKKLFPSATIVRFDTDSKKGERLHDVYQAVHDGQYDIIVGTQTVARGLDLPLLHTVGVISADTELLLPDFAASERAFQLLYQVIGRVGRQHGGGTVVIQTHNPQHPALQAAINRDYQAFYSSELQIRHDHQYPPFRYLVVLVTSYKSRAAAQTAAQKKVDQLKTDYRRLIAVIGPAPAFYERRGSQYRWIVVVKTAKRSVAVDIAEKHRSSRWQIDIDPTNLLY
jgi:primosomal protein N' (replication factor Y)